MSTKTIKIERILDEASLKSLLDTIALLAQSEEDQQTGPENFRKIKLTVKQEFGQAYAKLKVSLPETVSDAEAEAAGDKENDCISPGEELIKYSKLKKRMKTSFKAINANLAEDQLPPEEAVASFLADSDMMVCYPGYGDEFYLDYSKLVKALTKAWKDKDVPALKESAAALTKAMVECHDKYK